MKIHYLLLCAIYVVVLMFFTSKFVFASEDLTISIPERTYRPDETIDFEVTLPGCFELLKIRAKTSLGTIQIYNKETARWTDTNNNWRDLPYISSKMQIRVLNVIDANAAVTFEVQNAKTGQTFSAGPVSLWFTSDFVSYIKRFNAGMLKYTRDHKSAF